MKPFNQVTRELTLRPFLKRSNVAASWLLVVNYGLIMLAFILPALVPQWWAYIVSVVLLGNRQLGLGILMHDCVHSALFKTKSLNILLGEWLCAAPILAQFKGYQTYHLQHHAKAGTKNDPDYVNYQPYPVSKQSLYRKFTRDILAITGLKNLFLLFLMHAGTVKYDMAYKPDEKREKLKVSQIAISLINNLYRAVVWHSVLLSVLTLTGHSALYFLWWVAYLTTFSLFSRIRNAAEHASVPDLLDVDPRLHARTVYANWFERLTVAPNHVNFHIEHHWMPQVPPYQLPKLHNYLKQHGALDNAEILPNYRAVIHKLA